MKTKSFYFSFFYFAIFCLLPYNTIFATGKIFTKSDADSLYGPVKISKEIKTEQLKGYCQQTSKNLMFSIIDGKLYILGDNRKPLFPEDSEIKPEQVFQLYSLSIVEELLNKGGNDITMIEQRDKVLTITNGDFTLEESTGCPPVCSPNE